MRKRPEAARRNAPRRPCPPAPAEQKHPCLPPPHRPPLPILRLPNNSNVAQNQPIASLVRGEGAGASGSVGRSPSNRRPTAGSFSSGQAGGVPSAELRRSLLRDCGGRVQKLRQVRKIERSGSSLAAHQLKHGLGSMRPGLERWRSS